LVDQSGHARLADFGLLTIISDPTNYLPSSSYTQGGTARWISPELIAPRRFGFEDSRPTKPSDCYALGMVIYETITGNLPFYKDTDLTVFVKVVEGERPPRGARFPDNLWNMLELCWVPRPNGRPSVEDVLRCLGMTPNLPEPPSPWADERMDKDCDDWDSTTGSSAALHGTGDATATEWSPATPATPGVNSLQKITHNSVGPSSNTPFSRELKARRKALGSQLPLQEGRKVAFYPPPGSSAIGPTHEHTWILAVVTKCINQYKDRSVDPLPSLLKRFRISVAL